MHLSNKLASNNSIMHLSNKLASNDLILRLTNKIPCIKEPLFSAVCVCVSVCRNIVASSLSQSISFDGE